MALVRCKFVPITFTDLLGKELFLRLGCVLAILQAIVEVVEENDIRVLQLLLHFPTNACLKLQSELVALVLRH